MDWTTPPTLHTINGYHIALWILGYCTWRFLRHPRRAAVATVTSKPAATVDNAVTARRAVALEQPQPVDRWARRAELLAGVGRVDPRRLRLQRRLRKAA